MTLLVRSVFFMLVMLLWSGSAVGQTFNESEPNDTPGTADVAGNGTLQGSIGPSQIDYWKFAANGGDVIGVSETSGSRTLKLYDTDGTTVLASTTNGLTSPISQAVGATGTYFVSIETPLASTGAYAMGLSGSTAATLPVELTAFSATVAGEAVMLAWETASETNNAGFSVERKAMSEERWTEAAWVTGYGTTTEAQTYRHTLVGVAPGTYRFRLKQVDFDGTFAYSPEVEATVLASEAFVLGAPSPNPSVGQTALTVAVRQAQAVTVEVFDVLGRRVATPFAGTVEAGARSVSLDTAGWAPGVYFVRARGATHHTTRRLLVR